MLSASAASALGERLGIGLVGVRGGRAEAGGCQAQGQDARGGDAADQEGDALDHVGWTSIQW